MDLWILVTTIVILCSNFCVPVIGVKYIDLSYTIGNRTVLWPGHRRIGRIGENLQQIIDTNDQWFVSSSFTMSEHTSTHIDSPYHVYPKGWRLSEIPTSRLYDVPGVMIDMSWKIANKASGIVKPNYATTREDLMQWELKYGKIPSKSLVLLRQGWDAKWKNGANDFLGIKPNGDLEFPGFSLNGARLLAERNVYGVGIDTVSIDPGYSAKFPAHVMLGSRNIYMIENVANTQYLPPTGFRAFVFPIKIDQGTGSPVRVFGVVG